MRMPKTNEHGDVFLRVRIYEKCSYYNHKTIKQHSKQAPHHARFPQLPCIYKSTKAIGSFGEYFAVKERSFPVFLLMFLFGVFVLVIPGPAAWSCCLVLLPGPAAWSCCLVLLPGPAAWSCCLVLLPGPAAWSCCLVLLPGPAAWSCCLVLLPGPAAWSCCLVLLPGPAAWSCCLVLVLLPGPAAWSCCLVRLGPV